MLELFGKQEKIYPKHIWGRYRKLKWLAIAVTLGIYYFAPLLRWDRGPHVPNQAILIDLPNRRAYWFGIEIWPQEVYLLAGILIFSAIVLFFVTSLFGRVWCGYFCPQTVWTDLFVFVEKIIQGDRNQRMKLHNGPWTFEKTWKIIVTHFLWLVIAWCTSGSFVLYFNDAPTLISSFLEFNVSSTVLYFIIGLTLSTYIMAGFAREQVCTYMCPYARFQSAMFDKDTLIIGYDEARGEPRGKHKAGQSWEGRGHCIDCTACVQVCPMGIDIRNGLQMECIACGLCIDACDDIMDKMELPRGLVRYDTSNHMTHKRDKFQILRPRTIYYTIVICIVGVAMLYTLLSRAPLETHVLHDRNPLFVALSDGKIRNGYDINILNKTHEHREFTIEVEGIEDAEINLKGNYDDKHTVHVPANTVGKVHVFVETDKYEGPSQPINFIIEDTQGTQKVEHESIFISKTK